MCSQELIERAITSAASWVEKERGWDIENYQIRVSELQSCPEGYLSIDVICQKQVEDSDLLRFSRVLEIEVNTGKIETVLAARDPEKLRKCLQLEHVKVQTEILHEINNKPKMKKSEDSGDEISFNEIELREMLLENDPHKRLEEIEAEIQRARLFKFEPDSIEDQDTQASEAGSSVTRDVDGLLRDIDEAGDLANLETADQVETGSLF